VNIKRFIIAVVAIFVAVFATDFLMHSVWLMNTYRATASLWRPELETGSYMGWLFLSQLVWAVTFVTLWVKGFAEKACLGCAALYGLFMGVFLETSTLVLYAVQPFPGSLAAKWFIANTVRAVLMGLVAYFIYRPKVAPAASA
jgi:hypothetical protein